MKNSIIIAGLMMLSANSNAAVLYQHYSCGVTHGENTKFPIPDAPTMGLRCYVGVGGVSGNNISCNLLTFSLYPVGRHSEIKLQTISYENGKAILKHNDTIVKLNTHTGKASIQMGNSLFTECKYQEPVL